MGKLAKERLEREFKEALKSKERYRWYREIHRLVRQGWTAQAACKEVGVSRSTYNYWHRHIVQRKRCMQPGARITVDMFKSLSKAPHYSPRQISDEVKDLIVKIRKKSGKGAEWIQYDLKTKYQIHISVTGIYKTLKGEGLVIPRTYHQKKVKTVIRRDYLPGDKVQIDTKHVKVLKSKTYYCFSAIDVATGIIFKALYENIDPASACSFLRDVQRFMPFKIRHVQTDNGIEYTWRLHTHITQTHPFTLQCDLMNISHVLIPPASPTYNSHVERTHRVDNEELWRTKRFCSVNAMRKALKRHVVYYNQQRPAQSKKWRTPIEYANEEFGLNISRLRYRVQDV